MQRLDETWKLIAGNVESQPHGYYLQLIDTLPIAHGAYAMIDSYVQKGTAAAAASCKRVIYGPSPADKKLHAWLGPEEQTVE